jgi:nucleotide-binding universal stress UspA family protein
MSDAQLHLACQMANDLGGIVRVLHVVVRPRHLPLDAPLLTDEQAQAETLLDRAAQILQHYDVQAHVEAVLARSVADAIIDDARAHRAHTIFIGLRDRQRPHARLLWSATVRQVLRNAPCPVQIGYLPATVSAAEARQPPSP